MNQTTSYTPFLPQARALHRDMVALDTHCDTPSMLTLRGWDLGTRHPGGTLLGGDVDLPRMEEGGLAGAFFAVYTGQGPCTPEGYAKAQARAEEMLAAMEDTLARRGDRCGLAVSPEDARRLHREGKRALFLGLENGYPLGLELDRLEGYHRRGIRYVTLCHAADNQLCASCTSSDGNSMTDRVSEDTGLTELGAEAVKRMQRLGIMVDLSHTSPRTVEHVLQIAGKPVLVSHSGAHAVAGHPRNLTDSQLKAIARNGGVIQVPFVPMFVKEAPPEGEGDKAAGELWTRMKARYSAHALGEDPDIDRGFDKDFQALLAAYPPPAVSVSDVADHIDHVAKIAGIEHVGIGSDFDGGARLVDCRDVSEVPHLTAELLRRGYTEQDIRLIWGENLMRVMAAQG